MDERPDAPADFWVRPPSGPAEPLPPARGSLLIVSVIARSIDLFLRRPVPFLLLAMPSAVVSILASLLYFAAGGQAGSAPDGVPRVSVAAALTIVVGLVAIVVAIVLSLAMTLAADDVRAGRTVDVRRRLSQGVRRSGIAILSGIAEFLAVMGLFLLGAIVFGLLAVTGSPLLIVVAAVAFVALVVVVVWAALRWALAGVSIALEPVGPLQALGRSRAVTRGNVWRIVGVYLILGLIMLPLSGGIGLLSVAFSDVTPIVSLFGALVSLATVPLFGIVPAMIFGDLTSRPEAPRRPVDGQLRLGYLGGLVIAGVVVLTIAIPRVPAGFERIAQEAIPAEARGVIRASYVRNPFDPCQPIPIRGQALTSSLPIYVGGYFRKPIASGQTGTVELYLDGQLQDTFRIGDPSRAVHCWFDPEPLVHAGPGTWRVVVQSAGEGIAEGEFSVD